MKINTDLKNNFIICYDEARGVSFYKRKILKYKKNKSFSFILTQIFFITLLLIISISFSLLSTCNKNIYLISNTFYVISIIYFYYAIISMLCSYFFRKKNNFNNIVTFNKEGIIDESFRGLKIIVKWDKVLGIVVGKNTITILTDTPIYFYFDIKEKDNIFKVLEKYNINDKVIY